MQMRLQRLIQTQAQKRRRANKMANENPVAQTGKQAIGSWLKSKGTAIGVAVGVALTSLGDYLLGDTGLIAFCIGLVKQAIAFF
jgi:hypothetical protein